jgi:hypothetical protein
MVQWCAAAFIHSINVGTARFHQVLNDCAISSLAHSKVQWSSAAIIPSIHFGTALLHQALHNVEIATLASQVQRCEAKNTGAVLHQVLSNDWRVAVTQTAASQVQWCATKLVHNVNVSAVLHQVLNHWQCSLCASIVKRCVTTHSHSIHFGTALFYQVLSDSQIIIMASMVQWCVAKQVHCTNVRTGHLHQVFDNFQCAIGTSIVQRGPTKIALGIDKVATMAVGHPLDYIQIAILGGSAKVVDGGSLKALFARCRHWRNVSRYNVHANVGIDNGRSDCVARASCGVHEGENRIRTRDLYDYPQSR